MNLEVVGVEDFETRVVKTLVSKQLWLDAAEIFDAWRIVPRAIMAAITHLVLTLDSTVVYWFLHLPNDHRSGADAAAATGIVTVLSTLFGFALKFYIDNGRKWSKD
jgi:hypothetical protein